MNPGVLLDTSFLIALYCEDHGSHESAESYFAFWAQNGYTMYLSTVAVAEYTVRDAIPPTLLGNAELIVFDYEDATTCGELLSKKHLFDDSQTSCPHPGQIQSAAQPGGRVAVKDDFKLLAQAICRNCKAIATRDSKMVRHCEKAKDAGVADIAVVDISQPFNEGFARLERTPYIL